MAVTEQSTVHDKQPHLTVVHFLQTPKFYTLTLRSATLPDEYLNLTKFQSQFINDPRPGKQHPPWHVPNVVTRPGL